jgi:hypothetical protein
LFAAYKDVTKHPNLVIGVNDAGEVVLQIYNDNGILLWDLGKDGLQNRFQNTTSTVQNFNSSFDYGLYLNSNNMFDEKGKYSDEFLDDVKKYN